MRCTIDKMLYMAAQSTHRTVMKKLLWIALILAGMATTQAVAADARCTLPHAKGDATQEEQTSAKVDASLCEAGIYEGLDVNRVMKRLRKSGWKVDADIFCGEGWDAVCSFSAHKKGMGATFYLRACTPDDGCKAASKRVISSWEAD